MPVLLTDQISLETLCRLTGLIGVLLYISGFLLLSTGRIDSARPGYFTLIFIAAICVLISLCIDFNMSSALIQMFYICMSANAVVLRLRRKTRNYAMPKAGTHDRVHAPPAR